MAPLLRLLRSLHLFPSLLVTLLVLAIVPIADRGAPASAYLVLGCGMLLFQFTIGLVNDIVDVDDDRTSKPWKPLVRYEQLAPMAIVIAAVMGLSGVAVTLQLPWGAWMIGVLGLLCGLSYDLYFKRTNWSWLPYSVAFPLLPLWVYVALDAWTPLLWWVLPLGVVLGTALHLANQAPDAVLGASSGLAGWLGERWSRRLAVGLFASVAVTVLLLLREESTLLSIGSGVVGACVLGFSFTASALLGRNSMFHAMAVGGMLLTILFLVSL